jgi:hypothetical protein
VDVLPTSGALTRLLRAQQGSIRHALAGCGCDGGCCTGSALGRLRRRSISDLRSTSARVTPRHEQTGMWLALSHERERRPTGSAAWSDLARQKPAGYFEPFNLLHRNQMMENEPPSHTACSARRRPSLAGTSGGSGRASGTWWEPCWTRSQTEPSSTCSPTMQAFASRGDRRTAGSA